MQGIACHAYVSDESVRVSHRQLSCVSSGPIPLELMGEIVAGHEPAGAGYQARESMWALTLVPGPLVDPSKIIVMLLMLVERQDSWS